MACKWCGDLFDHCLVHPSPFWKHALVKKQDLGVNVIWNCRWFLKSSCGSSPPPLICPPFLLFLETTPSKLHETEKSLVSLIFAMLILMLVSLMKLTQLSSSAMLSINMSSGKYQKCQNTGFTLTFHLGQSLQNHPHMRRLDSSTGRPLDCLQVDELLLLQVLHQDQPLLLRFGDQHTAAAEEGSSEQASIQLLVLGIIRSLYWISDPLESIIFSLEIISIARCSNRTSLLSRIRPSSPVQSTYSF